MKLFTKTCIKALMLISLSLSLALPASAETVTIPVPKSLITDAVNTALSGVKIKVDNYGSKSGTSWLNQQSYVQFPTGQKTSFDIEESKYKIVGGRHLKHYVNELNSKSIVVSAPDKKLKLSLTFESEGEEVKGKCVRKKAFGGYKECNLKMERDIHVNNAKVEVSVRPVLYKNSISFDQPKATFTAKVTIPNKLCKLAKGVCKKIENKIYNQLKSKLESNIEKQLAKKKLKDFVANKVKVAMQPLIEQNWKLTKLNTSGNLFTLTVQRPDVIDGKSVAIKGFSVKQQNAQMNCPGTIPFTAKIATSTKVSGRAWLEQEDGKKSKAVPWKMTKKGQASSTLNRVWNVDGYAKQNGWARLVIEYTTSSGQKLFKKSGKVSFSRTCTKPSLQLKAF